MSTITISLKQKHSCSRIIETKITATEDSLFRFILKGMPLAELPEPPAALVYIPLGENAWMAVSGNIENTAIDTFRGTLCPGCGTNIIKESYQYPAEEIQIVWDRGAEEEVENV